jgi:hypothetical protein
MTGTKTAKNGIRLKDNSEKIRRLWPASYNCNRNEKSNASEQATDPGELTLILVNI